MQWDLGLNGLLYLAAMSITFGLLAQLLAWRAGPKWLWAVVSAVYFGVGILVSEVWFGWATQEDLQPNIDGLFARGGVLGVDLVLSWLVVFGLANVFQLAHESIEPRTPSPTHLGGASTSRYISCGPRATSGAASPCCASSTRLTAGIDDQIDALSRTEEGPHLLSAHRTEARSGMRWAR